MVDDLYDSFDDMVEEKLNSRNGEPFPHSTAEQASVIIRTFFANAEENVRIATGSLNPSVFGRDAVVNAAKRFLSNKNRKLEIIFLNDVSLGRISRHPLLSEIAHAINMEVHQLNDQKDELSRHHYAIMDNDCYRYKNDPSSQLGIAAFGDRTFTPKLLSLFEHTKSCSRMIPISSIVQTDTVL